MTAPYVMAMCQPETRLAFAEDGSLMPDVLDENVRHYCDLIEQAARDHGARLIAFPQFGLTGYGQKTTTRHWVEGSEPLPNRVTHRIGEAARRAKAWVVVQMSEVLPEFPGRYFLSNVLFSDEGRIAAIYRKHYSLSLRTSPIDVFDEFVAAYGTESLWPVVHTPIGSIGMCIGAEVNWPEVVRTLTLKGAEIVVNTICAPSPSLDYVDRMASTLVRPVRAFENQIYLGMANTAPRQDGDTPSEIYDYNGDRIARAEPCAIFTLATVDIEALRAARARPHINYVAQIQAAIHPELSSFPHWPANTFPESAPTSFETIYALETDIRDRLTAQAHESAPPST